MLTGPVIVYPSGDFSPPDDVVEVAPPFPTQLALEFQHLQHFKRLVKTQLPHLAFRLVGNGANPPDFLIRRAEDCEPFGMELTTFGTPTQERQSRVWRFSFWQERLLAAYARGRLAGLSGLKFAISFGSMDAPAPPPDRVDEELFEQLVVALEGVAKLPRPSMSAEPFAEEWPSGAIDGGAINWRLSGVSQAPFRGSKLADYAGFEVELTVDEYKGLEESVRQMESAIAEKDRPENRELLIVAGGPTRSGRAFSAGAVIALHVAEAWKGLATKPTYLHRVFLDIWGLEKVVLLHEKSL